MKTCGACGSSNGDDAKFCAECGTSLQRRCPSCGTPADRGKFCAECGTALDADQTASTLVGQPTAERRVTSVLFGDLVGFTTLSESRDPEEVRELLSRYFSEGRTVIGRYGGVVEKFIGDAVMAVWGVPTTHEDDAERAVRAGLELVETVAALGDEVGAPGLGMRVGVVTGEVAVTVGAVGEGMVAGDAVNTASRVQSVAQPNEVWVDDVTRGLTSSAIAYADAGEHSLKGKNEPLRLWHATAVVASVRGAQRIDGLEAPLVGRDRQVRLIKELFHAAEESRRPSLVVLDGEPGVGKSRLAWEFEKYIDGLQTSAWWHRGRCLSYGEGVAFWALSEALRPRLGLVEADGPEAVAAALDARLSELVPDETERAWLRPRLSVLLSTGESGGFSREELYAAWTGFFERLGASGEAVVWVIDDAQYADDGLLDFLDHLLSSARAGIFVLALARPELLVRRPDLGGRRTTVIRLEPLDDATMNRLVDGLVVGLPETVRGQLVERSEGVPLFAVETVRALIDRDLVVPKDGVYQPATDALLDLETLGAPASLQALVATRLDALSAAERRAVADASVLGVTFTSEGLAALGSEDLDAVLPSLQRKEIIRLEQDRFSAERGQFRFVQSVVRQIAYSMQSRRDRKARHLAAAAFLEGGLDADELAMVVAQHLLDAVDASGTDDADLPDLIQRARELLRVAGQRALDVGSPREARRLFESALERTDDPGDRAELLLSAATAAMVSADFSVAIERATEATALFDSLARPVDAALAVACHATVLTTVGENAAARTLTEQRLGALEGILGNEVPRERLLGVATTAAIYTGDMAAAGRWALERLPVAEGIGAIDGVVDAQITLGLATAQSGAPTTALSLFTSAVELAEARGAQDGDGYVRALVNLAAFNIGRDPREAHRLALLAVENSRRRGNRARLDAAVTNLCTALWVLGYFDELHDTLAAMDHPGGVGPFAESAVGLIRWWYADAVGAERTLPTLRETDDHMNLAWQATLLADEARSRGDTKRAIAISETSLENVLHMGMDDDFPLLWSVVTGIVLDVGAIDVAEQFLATVERALPDRLPPAVHVQLPWLRGRLMAARGDDPRQAEAEMRRGIDALRSFSWRTASGPAQEHLARWLAEQGRADDAAEMLAAARSTYQEIGATGWLQRLDESAPIPITAS